MEAGRGISQVQEYKHINQSMTTDLSDPVLISWIHLCKKNTLFILHESGY